MLGAPPGGVLGRLGMTTSRSFEDLVAEGAVVPLEGWDFSWFAGRATEERPPWGYAGLVARRVARASAVLDVETGGGEVFAWALEHASAVPPRLAATELWPPNVEIARRRLAPFGVEVVVGGDDPLPFASASFDLVISRHPVRTDWEDVARVLRPGGTVLSQQIGPGSNRELTDFLMGPQPVGEAREPATAALAAQRAGLVVTGLRRATLRVELFDVAAVVHFLRKVPWTVPGFTVERYRDRLAALHDEISRTGSFVCHSTRFLVEAARP